MVKYADKVVEQAKAWIGKKESNGTHKEIIDVYNGHKPLARGYKVKYTDAWCSTFVSAVAIKLGYTSIIPTECGCEKHIELFKKIGAWVEADDYVPSAGDIIFYDWEDNGKGDNKGKADHVGYVEKVSNQTITIIEGNYKNAVGRRTMKVNAKYIRGYGVPKYDKKPTTTTVTVSVSKTKYKVVEGDTLIKIAKKYNTTVDAIAKLNNIKNKNIIKVGQTLEVPKVKTSKKQYKRVKPLVGVWSRTSMGILKKPSNKYKAIPYNTKLEVIKENVGIASGYRWDLVVYKNKECYVPNTFLK